MQIVHRVGITSTPEIRRELANLGIVVPDTGIVAFDVDEANEHWPELQKWIARRHASDIPSTRFSSDEIEGATWLEMMPNWHQGYPQPNQADFGYLQASYDLSDYCEECGMGLRQRAPFQMKSEPKWGRNGILQLNWIFDEYFTTPAVWNSLFRPHGVSVRSVTNTKGLELKTVVQLAIEQEVGVTTTGLSSETCRRCSRTKYLPVQRGRFPALAEKPPAAVVRTRESFGSGRVADRRVIVSQGLAHDLRRQGIRGVSLRPVRQ